MLEVSGMLEGMTNLSNLIEASEVKSKFQSFFRMNIWASQLGLLKLLRSLGGKIEFNKIITGYFCSSSFTFN